MHVCDLRSRHVGSNLEHANSLELSLEPGSTNHMFVGLQTEEAPIALYINATQNTVVWGALLAFWNASQISEVRSIINHQTRHESKFRSLVSYQHGQPHEPVNVCIFTCRRKWWRFGQRSGQQKWTCRIDCTA